LPVIRNSGNAFLAPAKRFAARRVAREVFPRTAMGAVIFARLFGCDEFLNSPPNLFLKREGFIALFS
jgi:hypothetical protein